MTIARRVALLALGLALAPLAARAQETAPSQKELDALYETVSRLEHRINELESERAPGGGASGGRVDWSERIRLSGSAELDYLQGSGEDYGLYEEGSTQIYDTRIFLDADLGSDARIGESTVFRDAGFSFEWNLIRLGSVRNEVGDMYVDLRGVGGRDFLNLEAGRFQIPFGENYLRFGRGRASDPFIALSAAPPWFWDEGIKLWGKSSNGRFGYVASVTDGEGGINVENNSSKQITLKLSWDPSEWLHLSASGLRTGKLGSSDTPAVAALWLGEAFPKSFGAGSGAVNYSHGAPIPDGPNELSNITVIGADAIMNFGGARIWLAAGNASIDSTGPSLYDRDLHYWLAEVVYQLRELSPALDPIYLAARANGLGTYDDDEGYLLDFRYRDIGYNMRALDAYALALGLPLGSHMVLKAQYAIQNMDLVRGITDEDMRDAADDADFFGMEIGVHF
jgi:hypothetical protein